jgi:acyl carrier protein
MEISHLRQAVLEALKAAIPGAFGEEMGRSFLAGELNVELARFGMDSLARMEFCIAIELSTGVTLLPSQLEELATTDAIARCIREKLGQA